MAENKKEIELEEDEILRISVRKKDPNSDEYDIYACYDSEDNEAVKLLKVFEETMQKELEVVEEKDIK